MSIAYSPVSTWAAYYRGVGGYAPDLAFEREAWRNGAVWVAGVDEVGVGPLAGPVTAGVVAIRREDRHPWFKHVRDSKVLSPATREELAALIRESASCAVGWASHEEIDRIGILPARRLCMLRAIEQLPVRPSAIISDALSLPLEGVRPVIDADALSVSVAAASILAKVARDRLMVELDEQYPGWGFARHKGYPTAEHRSLLQERGPLPIHRRSYAPVAQLSLPW
jgi:ribonuclease HII